MTRGSTALPAALVALAVSTALGAALAELTRIEVVLAAKRRALAIALAAADACLTEIVAGVPPGWDFAPLLAGPDGRSGTADDGVPPAPAGCTARARPAPGAIDPPRAVVALDAVAGGGRRALEALVGREAEPGVPALLWLGATPGADLAGELTLEGAAADDAAAPDWSGLAAPDDPAALDRWLANQGPHLVASARTQAALHADPPPLAALLERVRAAGPRGGESLVPTEAPPAALALVEGDLVVSGALHGAGLLVVGGALDIRGALDFTGVVVVASGIRVADGAQLTIAGALWAGPPAAAVPLDVSGRVALRQQRAALVAADQLLPLPRRPRLLGLRDLP